MRGAYLLCANNHMQGFTIKKWKLLELQSTRMGSKVMPSANFRLMVGRSVENANEIRPDIKTRALFSRGSTDIYADICTVNGSNLMS